jgi:prevent-host-death family protein
MEWDQVSGRYVLGLQRCLTPAECCTRNTTMKVLPIGEARQRLPELVRKITAGHPPIPIGRRGRPEAVLVPATSAASAPPQRRPLRGMLELVGGPDDLDRTQEEIRRLLAGSLDRSARQVVPPRRRRGAKRG